MQDMHSGMENLRCPCGKIICQAEGSRVIIKCRHCKRYIVIETGGILRIRSNAVEHVELVRER